LTGIDRQAAAHGLRDIQLRLFNFEQRNACSVLNNTTPAGVAVFIKSIRQLRLSTDASMGMNFTLRTNPMAIARA
jgi:hypothetical protein